MVEKNCVKNCLECGTPMVGRSDKKFCSDQCRSMNHNRFNSDTNRYVRSVNNVLRKNRRILGDLHAGGKVRVSADRLRERGFDFRYHTGTSRTKDGVIYYYCYEQGYLPVEKNFYLLVVKQDDKP